MGLQTGPDQACVGMGGGGDAPSPALVQCITAGLQLVSPIKRDAFAVSTYPHTIMASLGVQRPHWSPWFFPAVIAQLNASDATAFIIAETGYIADDLIVNLANGTIGIDLALGSEKDDGGGADPAPICASLLSSNVTEAEAWLTYVLQQGAQHDMPLITWWSDMDFLWPTSMSSCPCTVPPNGTFSCTFIAAYREIEALGGGAAWMGEINAKAFGTMGLRNATGGAKGNMLDIWTSDLAQLSR